MGYGPRGFGWTWTNVSRRPRWCVKFDGVLCRENTNAENDDGPRYAEFLANAEPLFIPQRAIGHIITGRAEKYRAETEAWLHRHGLQFKSLKMTPWPTTGERMEAMRTIG